MAKKKSKLGSKIKGAFKKIKDKVTGGFVSPGSNFGPKPKTKGFVSPGSNFGPKPSEYKAPGASLPKPGQKLAPKSPYQSPGKSFATGKKPFVSPGSKFGKAPAYKVPGAQFNVPEEMPEAPVDEGQVEIPETAPNDAMVESPQGTALQSTETDALQSTPGDVMTPSGISGTSYGATGGSTGTVSPYQQGFSALAGTDAPQSQGEAMGAVSGAMPAPSADTTFIDTMFQEDPVIANMQTMFTDYFSPEKQRESLTEEYERLTEESGIDKLDTELMNMKNIIEGTEDDIRAEVTKAGGFATDSQVMAMTNSRNDSL